jgi:hypothetical protein
MVRMRKETGIFESFVKIAQEKGLVSNADHAEHTEKDLDNPRWDSLSIEQIGKLYNTKTKKPEDMEYEKNIMEDAHPEPVVMFRSHDKLNSLIENENEGQTIRLNIVNKIPNGQLTQHKYAEKQLVLSLVRLANDLDNRNQDELRVLADTCLVQTTQPTLKKTALIPFAVYPIAAAIGAVYAKNHLALHSDGFTADYEKAVNEIDDLLNSNSNWGVGYSYTPQFMQTVNQLKTNLAELNTEVQKALPVLNNLETPRNANELKVLAQQPETHEAAQALNGLTTVMTNIYPFIKQVATDFGSESYKQRAIEHKGVLTSLIDAPGALHGGKGLVADDFDDVRHALQTLMADVVNISKGLSQAETLRKTAIQQLSSAESTVSQMTAKPAEEAKPEASIEGEVEEAMKGFGL